MPDFTKSVWVTIVLSVVCIYQSSGQKIVDPCFSSISPTGSFNNSEDIINLCRCSNNFIATDLLEWDGAQWAGRLRALVDLPPPQSCNTRAIWLGSTQWTGNGEAFALRLDKPLESNKTYTFTFTYAKDGDPDDEDNQVKFSPIVYTDNSQPALSSAFKVGRLPDVLNSWETHSIIFTATSQQNGHSWIILHALETCGIVFSNCSVGIPQGTSLLPADTSICINDPLVLQLPQNNNYEYLWSTQATNSSITISDPGIYFVDIKYGHCIYSDSIAVDTEDCEPFLLMPNIFTPNHTDDRNPVFAPMEYNYIESGEMVIYNRWGGKLYTGELFQGWDGKNSPTGVYYYVIYYRDKKKIAYSTKGFITLAR